MEVQYNQAVDSRAVSKNAEKVFSDNPVVLACECTSKDLEGEVDSSDLAADCSI